jgi:hypothetical protein
MSNINIKFNAFIAASIAKPLKEFFKNDSRIKNASNRNDFLSYLDTIDGFWIPGPVDINHPFKDQYVKTDGRTFGQNGTYRLRLEANIDSGKILKKEILIPSNKIYLDAVPAESHRCLIGFNNNLNSFIYPSDPSHPYDNMYSDVSESTEEKFPLFENICNSNISTIEIKGFMVRKSRQSGYPFAEPFSPNIDISYDLFVQKVGNKIFFRAKGVHNKFPYYEILCNNKLVYSYYPTKIKEFGPGILNLNSDIHFDNKWSINS